MSTENEVWKAVKGYEGFYEAGSSGSIRSVDRVIPHGAHGSQRILRGRIIRHWINCKGYKVVALSKDGVVKNKAVHKLVCDVFHDNPNNYPCVNHKNGIKTDCAETNLEHASYSQNNQHAFDTLESADQKTKEMKEKLFTSLQNTLNAVQQ